MANFMYLPKAVREQIYRLHLVEEGRVITLRDYKKFCGRSGDRFRRPKDVQRAKPHVFHVSNKIEREASRIYFGENTFALIGPEELRQWKLCAWPRHIHLIRKVALVEWCKLPSPIAANEAFTQLGKMPKLESLDIWFDENEELRHLLLFDPVIRCAGRSTIGSQINLQLLRLPGMQGFRSIRGIKKLTYSAVNESNGEEVDGAIPGGLMNSIRREILGKTTPSQQHKNRPFHFLDLPPEIRNIIYKMLLSFPGATYPINTEPVSIASQYKHKSDKSRAALKAPRSALDILLVNRHLQQEAYPFFYQNDLFFSTPARFQNFMVSLSDSRIECLRSLTLFNEHGRLVEAYRPYLAQKMHNEDSLERTNNMEVAMLLIRRLPNLRKLHFLYRSTTMSTVGPYETKTVDIESSLRPADVGFMFQMRNLSDIKVRDLDLELDEELNSDEDAEERNKQKAILKHLNHGLQLAQKGMVVRELFGKDNWHDDETWPVLQGSNCGSGKGCTCRLDED